jgi:hypothetical protein
MAPAVLGRESSNSRVGLRDRATGLPHPSVIDIIEVILSETECIGRAVIVLEVSVEIKESGRGINSKVSENPTRVRVGGLEGVICVNGSSTFSS